MQHLGRRLALHRLLASHAVACSGVRRERVAPQTCSIVSGGHPNIALVIIAALAGRGLSLSNSAGRRRRGALCHALCCCCSCCCYIALELYAGVWLCDHKAKLISCFMFPAVVAECKCCHIVLAAPQAINHGCNSHSPTGMPESVAMTPAITCVLRTPQCIFSP